MSNTTTTYKQTEVGLIPSDWEVKAIGQEIDLITGFPFPSSGYSENGIRLLRCSNVKRGVTDWSEGIVQYWSEITPELKPYILNEGDIVIAMDGSLVGKSFARLTQSDLPAILLQRVARIRSNKIDVGYLKEFVCSDYFTKYCDTVKTSSAIPHISPSDIRGFAIPVPPTKVEQILIANALSDTDCLIKGLEKIIIKKRNIKQGAMQKLLQPKEGWVVKSLGDICEIYKGKGISKSQIAESGKTECILYGELFTTYKEVIFNISSKTNIENGVFSNAGDILFPGSTTTTGIDLAKASALMKENVLLGGDIVIVRKSNFNYNPIFLSYFLNVIKKYEIAQTTKGITIHHLYGKDLAGINLQFPKIEEQIVIANILTDMNNEITALETKLEKYKKVKLGMMQNLLTGKIRLI